MAPVLSLEFTDLECKVVLLDPGRGNRAAVKAVSSFELTKPDDLAERVAERAKALRDHLKSQKITAKLATVVIPKNFVMLRTVNLPSTVEDEIAGMARFEAERHIPFNADRHITSYHVLSRNGAQGSEVLIAAVDLPIAQEYLDVCVKAGLRVTGISVSSVALFNAFSATQRSALAERTVMIVNIGKSATDLVIVNNGNVTFTRGSTTGVNRLISELQEVGETADYNKLSEMNALEPQLYFRGGSSIDRPPAPAAAENLYDALPEESNPPSSETNPGFTIINDTPAPSVAASPENKGAAVFSGWLNRVLQEVKRTLEFASREFASPMVNAIYISGEGALVKNLADYFQANFHVDTAAFDPMAAGSPITAPKKMSAPGPAYALAIGGAISGQPNTLEIDLLPGSYTEAQTARRQQMSYIVTGVLALVLLVVGYIYLSDAFARKRELLEQLQTRNRADSTRVKDLRTKKERLRIIRENVQDDRGALDVLRIVSEKPYIPERVTLTSFDYKRGDYVRMEGDAKDLPSANQLVNDMRNTGFFAESSLDDVVANKPLRSRGNAMVTGWKATFTFPKPVQPKQRASRAQRSEDDLDGIE